MVSDGNDANVGEWRLNSDNRGTQLSKSIVVTDSLKQVYPNKT